MIAPIAIALVAGAFGGVLGFWGMFAFVEWVFASDKQRRKMRPRTRAHAALMILSSVIDCMAFIVCPGLPLGCWRAQ
jgi:hypothetical protein